jgi:hypothetical protein
VSSRQTAQKLLPPLVHQVLTSPMSVMPAQAAVRRSRLLVILVPAGQVALLQHWRASPGQSRQTRVPCHLQLQSAPVGFQSPPVGFQSPTVGFQSPPVGFQSPPVGF